MSQAQKKAMDNYLETLDRDPEEIQERQEFYGNLSQFYRKKWNCPVRIPNICGLKIDLFRLYKSVNSFGGWQKASNSSRWPDVLDLLEISDEIAEAEYAVKLVYMRYLSKFEQLQNSGDVPDDDDDTTGGRSGRGKGFMASLVTATECPINRRQDLPEFIRQSLGLSAYRNGQTPYDRIIRSLESGLSNEVDFALNICTLLSHPGPRFMQLQNSPKVIELLLAHVGIFQPGAGTFRQVYDESWVPTTGRRFVDFWRDSVSDEEIRTLVGDGDSKENPLVNESDSNLFAGITAEYNPKDPVCWRIYQIASILRNLSFEAGNKATLANSKALFSKWTTVQSMALDTLSNVASEMSLHLLEVQSKQLLFRTLSNCLHSEDKLHVIRSLETIAGLCSKAENENLLCTYLEPVVLQKIFSLVAVRDIMICVYVLECLYQVSELGNEMCENMAHQTHAIEVLINLATSEAVSFGPSGLMGMKVVEYHSVPQPHTAILPHPSQQLPSLPLQMTSSRSHLQPSPQPIRPPPPPPIIMPPPSPLPRPPSSQIASTPFAPRPMAPSGGQPGPNSPNFRGPAVTVHQDQQVEVLTTQWLRQNCVVDASAVVSRGELYANYVNEMHKIYNSLAVSVHMFSNIIKNVFPTSNMKKTAESATTARTPLMQIDGIRYDPTRAKSTLPLSSQVVPPSQSPHFRCPSPVVSGSSGPASPANLASQHPLMQQILSRNGSNPSSPKPSSSSSSSVKHPTLSNRLVSTVPSAANRLNRTVSIGSHPDSVGTSDDISGTATPDSFMSDTSVPSPKARSVKSRSKSPKSVKLPTNCKVKLEVCEEAQTASSIIEDSESHEARIVRVENTTVQSTPSPKLPEPQKPTQELSSSIPVNGEVGPPPEKLFDEPKKRIINGLILDKKKKGNPKSKQKEVEPETNGPTETKVRPTPSPDMESMKINVNHCQESIEQLLTEKEKKEISDSSETLPKTNGMTEKTEESKSSEVKEPTTITTKKKPAPKKKASAPKAPRTRSKAKSPKPSKRAASKELADEAGPSSKKIAIEPKQTVTAVQVEIPLMCEWNGCGMTFPKASTLSYHAVQTHINESTIICKWPRCDQTVRSKWSMATHVQDRHCSEPILKAAARRRHEISIQGCSNIPEPKEPPPHPGYSKNAAIEAIRRHAYNYMQRDLTDDNEGPVTKSIRLTSCLILRNLARYSPEGRRKLKKHERHLSWLSLSRLESSGALAQCLAELSSPPHSPTADCT